MCICIYIYILKPPQQHSGPNSKSSGNSQQEQGSSTSSEMQDMRDKIKSLEQQLSNQQQGNNYVEIEQPLPKNISAVPSSGRDDRKANNNTNNKEQINDILQIISTTMATLKDFENRYRN